MKVPLRFQITEFDCGTVSLQNVISYLYDRESIPAELIRAISLYTLDCYDTKGNLGNGGTSREAINLITHWIVDYSKRKDFNLECQLYEGDNVNEDNIRKCIEKKGVVLLRTYQDIEHYVIITKFDDNFVYMWDCYYLDENYYDSSNSVTIIFNEPFKYNRKVSLSRFNSHQKLDFALGPIDKRECVCFNNVNKNVTSKLTIA